jgi:membrane-associated protease RseP (regulator of RpoE activity)
LPIRHGWSIRPKKRVRKVFSPFESGNFPALRDVTIEETERRRRVRDARRSVMRHVKSVSLFGGLALVMSLAPMQSAIGEESQDFRSVLFVRDGGGFLGVQLEEVDAKTADRLKLAEERGALVRKVESGSPAEEAGLQADDVIVRYQGGKIESARQLARLVRETPAGRKVVLEVVRGGAVRTLTATLDERSASGGPQPFHFTVPDIDVDVPQFEVPDIDVDARHFEMPLPQGRESFFWKRWFGPPKLGIKYQRISGQLAQYFGLESGRGILVTSVDADGPAGKAGMKAGDVLVTVSGEKIRSASDLHEALEDVEPGQEVAVTVLREGKTIDLKVVAGGERKEKSKKALEDARIKIQKKVVRDKSI